MDAFFLQPYLFQLQPECLQADDGSDEFLLVSLDAFDGNHALGELVGVLLLGGLGLCGFLLGILGCSLLGLEG
jgi:hypothetical protein